MSDRARGRRVCLAVVGVAVLASSLVAGPAAPALATPGAGATADGPATAASPNSSASWVAAVAPVSGYDTIEVRIDVASNGTAQWYIEYQYDLPSEAAVEGFRQASREVTNPPGVFLQRLEANVVADAESATGRAMRLERGRVETDLDVTAGEGSVIYRFDWTNFVARPATDRLVVGDAIRRYDLGPNESLMIEWSDRLSKASVSPSPEFSQQNAVRWTGPLEFRTEDPTVRLRTTSGSTGGPPVVPVALAVALLVVVSAGWYGRSRWLGTAGSGTAAGASESDTGPSDPDPGPDTDADGTADPDAEPPPELLSDEERVLRLLDDHDGRMKQQDLLGAVDWSRTKTSDVVNEMHEAGQIEVFRLGRENVLALPGEIEV